MESKEVIAYFYKTSNLKDPYGITKQLLFIRSITDEKVILQVLEMYKSVSIMAPCVLDEWDQHLIIHDSSMYDDIY